jgi:quercetin dioxygenase-like cupin family protein
MRNKTFLLVAALALTISVPAMADTGHAMKGLTRAVVKRGDVAQAGYEAVVARVTVAPGGTSGRHTHPGDEISYVVSGEGELLIDGEASQAVPADQAFIVPAGKVHELKNNGDKPLILIGTYLVKKGEPLATPTP